MYDRLTGTPPSPALLDELEARVAANGASIRRDVHPRPAPARTRSDFYSVTLKNFATPWTNRDQTVFAPLNDYTATVIGMVRDDADFRGAAFRRHRLYRQRHLAGLLERPSNAHYEALESNNADLRAVLQRVRRSRR